MISTRTSIRGASLLKKPVRVRWYRLLAVFRIALVKRVLLAEAYPAHMAIFALRHLAFFPRRVVPEADQFAIWRVSGTMLTPFSFALLALAFVLALATLRLRGSPLGIWLLSPWWRRSLCIQSKGGGKVPLFDCGVLPCHLQCNCQWFALCVSDLHCLLSDGFLVGDDQLPWWCSKRLTLRILRTESIHIIPQQVVLVLLHGLLPCALQLMPVGVLQ